MLTFAHSDDSSYSSKVRLVDGAANTKLVCVCTKDVQLGTLQVVLLAAHFAESDANGHSHANELVDASDNSVSPSPTSFFFWGGGLTRKRIH